MVKLRWGAGAWLCAVVLSLAAQPSALGADVPSSSRAGVIAGFIRIAGEIPKPSHPEITKSKDVCKDVPDETLVIGPGNGVRYAVVTLKGAPTGAAAEGADATSELDNAGCRFVPHVQVMGVDQFLLLKNTDPILHTAHALFHGGQPQFNVGLYPGRAVRKPMVAPGVVKIICEVHPWMSAYVVVTDQPYHAVTDVYGEYQIRDVPPGTYQLEVWHELLGTRVQKVEVKAGETSKVDFTLSSSQGAGQ
jgi:hypothetical protein